MRLITAHVAWRHHLRQFVDDQADEPAARTPTAAPAPCRDGGEFGVWLRGAGRRWARLPAFACAARAHAEVLRHAGCVVLAVAQGDHATARTLVGDTSALRRASQQVIAALEQLHVIVDAAARGARATTRR